MSGTTALIVPVPSALPLLATAGTRPREGFLRRDQPPHVTVLWPFVPPGRIDATVHRRLRALFAALPRFTAEFGHVGHFPTVDYLAPEDPQPFIALARAVVAAWPEHPPYAGEFADVVPHLTLRAASAAHLPDLQDRLPLRVDVTHVELTADLRWLGWRSRGRYPLRTS